MVSAVVAAYRRCKQGRSLSGARLRQCYALDNLVVANDHPDVSPELVFVS